MRHNCFLHVVLCAIAGIFVLSGCSVYVQPAQAPPPPPAAADTETVYQPPPADVVTVYQTDLNPYGHWVSDPTYGQCWVPNNCPPGWQPYTVGHWVYSDDGWTWVSDGDEVDWGPVVYHYGCWDQSSNGWCWVPGTTWAPAWVAWREGGGYCGWAPLPPQVAFNSDISPAAVDRYCPANQYTYVSEQYVNAPNVNQHIVRNNVTIINQTTNITNITYNDNRVVNQGVSITNVEHATGRPVEKVAIATATTPDEARKLVAAGKPVMYAPPAVTQAQSRQIAAGKAKIANPHPPANESQSENAPQHSPEAAGENHNSPSAQPTGEQPSETRKPAPPKENAVESNPNPSNPRTGEQPAEARRPAQPAEPAAPKKTAPADDEGKHEAEPSVEEKPKPAPNKPPAETPKQDENKSHETQTPPPKEAQNKNNQPADKGKPADDKTKADEQKKPDDSAK
jgi:hypothetical protein